MGLGLMKRQLMMACVDRNGGSEIGEVVFVEADKGVAGAGKKVMLEVRGDVVRSVLMLESGVQALARASTGSDWGRRNTWSSSWEKMRSPLWRD